MRLEGLDHIVLTVADVERTCHFYGELLGLEILRYAHGRRAVLFGGQKISLHQHGREFEPHSREPTPGAVELCFIATEPVTQVADELERKGVDILLPPHPRTGARGALQSLFLYDPDGNLVEISNYVDGAGNPAAEERAIRERPATPSRRSRPKSTDT